MADYEKSGVCRCSLAWPCHVSPWPAPNCSGRTAGILASWGVGGCRAFTCP